MLTLILALGLVQAPTGATVYENRCATCHAGTDPRTPTLASLKQKTPQAIVDALTNGVMRQQGSDMTDAEKRAVAEYLGTTTPVAPPRQRTTDASGSTAGACASTPPFDPSKGPQWNGWGVDVTNQRFQPAAQAGLTADQVPKLKLKWAFGFPNANSARGLPTIVGGRLFVGSMSGTVYALDAKSGCVIWTFKAQSGVRAGVVIGPRPGVQGNISPTSAMDARTPMRSTRRPASRSGRAVSRITRVPTSPARRPCMRVGCSSLSRRLKKGRG
jgi:polyvinyl alcohol dehydrogenase (cytochrome)